MLISDWSSDVCSSDLALATIALIFRIPVIHSPSANYTSKFLIILLNKAIKSGITINGPLIKRIKKGNHMQLQQLSILSSLPGVGDKLARSEERRVGKECVSTCRLRWWQNN